MAMELTVDEQLALFQEITKGMDMPREDTEVNAANKEESTRETELLIDLDF